MIPWTERRVIALAHQGGSFEGPSSTLAAIDHAYRVGVRAMELDVHATKDRHLVVCHDASVDRTTNHHGAIAALTLDELREMDNAYWWIEGDVVTPDAAPEAYRVRARAPAERRYGIATLDEVCVAYPDVLLNLDIKGRAPDVEAYEELLARELRRLERCDSVMVASFHDDVLAHFRLLAPEIATSAATNEVAAFYFSLHSTNPEVPPASALQVPARYADREIVNEQFVDAAHRAGLAVHVWTINDEREMDRLIDLGVDGIISDRPSLLVATLTRRGCAWDGRWK